MRAGSKGPSLRPYSATVASRKIKMLHSLDFLRFCRGKVKVQRLEKSFKEMVQYFRFAVDSVKEEIECLRSAIGRYFDTLNLALFLACKSGPHSYPNLNCACLNAAIYAQCRLSTITPAKFQCSAGLNYVSRLD